MVLTLLLAACSSSSPVADSGAGGLDSADTADSGRVVDTVGVRPEQPVPLPDFVATNMDETSRGPADLQGGPTVVWFYPAAGTYG